MTGKTKNLGMTTYSTITDASSVLVYSYIDQTSGCSTTTNIGILDRFAGEASGSISAISGSLTALNTIMENAVTSANIQIVEHGLDVDITSGIFYFRIPTELDGKNLIRAQGFVDTGSSGSSGSTVIQVRNMTKYASNDALATPIIINFGESAGSPLATINSGYDDVSTDDVLKIYVYEEEVDKPKGLQITMDFQ